MIWPWITRKRQGVEKAELERSEIELRDSQKAVEQSKDMEAKVREIELEAMALVKVSRTLARENHFGEMIDEALGLNSQRKHA